MKIIFLNLWTATIDGYKMIDGILFLYLGITRLDFQIFIFNFGFIIDWSGEL
jgi:hypothetical protein